MDFLNIILSLLQIILPFILNPVSLSFYIYLKHRTEKIKNYVRERICEKIGKKDLFLVKKVTEEISKSRKTKVRQQFLTIFSTLSPILYSILVGLPIFDFIISYFIWVGFLNFILFLFIEDVFKYATSQKETEEKMKWLVGLTHNLLAFFLSLATLEVLTTIFTNNIVSVEQRILLMSSWLWSSIFVILIVSHSIPKLIESLISKEIDDSLSKISKRSLVEIQIITKNKNKIKGYIKSVSNDDYLEIETKEGKRIPIFWNEILYVKI